MITDQEKIKDAGRSKILSLSRSDPMPRAQYNVGIVFHSKIHNCFSYSLLHLPVEGSEIWLKHVWDRLIF